MRLFWLLVGFLGGIAVVRNAAAMPGPVALAVVLAVSVLGVVGWFAARRDRAVAVATAVSVAVAEANARADAASLAASQSVAAAEAKAAATASQIMQVVLSNGQGLMPTLVSREASESVEAHDISAVEDSDRRAVVDAVTNPVQVSARPFVAPA